LHEAYNVGKCVFFASTAGLL